MRRLSIRTFALLPGILVCAQAFGQGLNVEVLSSFPELVTGGDALVRITGTRAAPAVSVASRDVSAAFVADASG
ncbi:MAG: DUF6351 family protein, partial [Gammaproteobacteria bacterium]|nr:DUF6351 family protein [Gammaproteobacteria bacterium]